MRAPLAVLCALAACDSRPERQLSVDDDPVEASPWKPDAVQDTAPDDGTLGGTCGADLTAEDGDLTLSACARVSPEESDGGGDTGAVLDTGVGLPGDAAPPPCGYFNLVGAVAMAGGSGVETLMYCDADAEGGLRVLRWAQESGTLDSQILREGTCWADFGAGDLVDDGGDLRAFWVELSDSAAGTQVYTATLDGAGGFGSTPISVPGGEGTRRVRGISADALVLIAESMEGSVYASNLATGETTALADEVATWGAAKGGPGVVVATCRDGADALTVSGLDGAGALLWQTSLDAAGCGISGQPEVVAAGDGVVIGWDDDEQGALGWVSASGEVLSQVSLGKASLLPVPRVAGDALWTVDGSGSVSRWSLDGEPLGAWTHRGIAGAVGQVKGLRFEVTTDRLTFTLIGQDSAPLSGGHVNTFNYLELSDAPVPTL